MQRMERLLQIIQIGPRPRLRPKCANKMEGPARCEPGNSTGMLTAGAEALGQGYARQSFPFRPTNIQACLMLSCIPSLVLIAFLHEKMMKILKQLFALSLLAFAGAALAAEAPDVLVKRVTEDVMQTARNDKEIKAGNRTRIVEVVKDKILPHLDFERATQLAIGRHWRDATPQQRQQLIDEFRALMIYTYAGAMSQISDQKLDYKPLRVGPDDAETEVRFRVLRPRRGEPVEVSYRMYKLPDGWKVYDVNVLGVWMTEVYRSSFSEEIARSGVDGLIRMLADKNRRLAARPALTPPSREEALPNTRKSDASYR